MNHFEAKEAVEDRLTLFIACIEARLTIVLVILKVYLVALKIDFPALIVFAKFLY